MSTPDFEPTHYDESHQRRLEDRCKRAEALEAAADRQKRLLAEAKAVAGPE